MRHYPRKFDGIYHYFGLSYTNQLGSNNMASVSKQKPFSQVGPPATIQTDSQFLRLPPEIRNMVYELVFQDHVTMMPCYGKTTTIGSGKIIAPGLLRTCKQVHYEALSMYYNLATFLFTRATTRRAKQWIKTIGDARVALVSNACFPTRYLGWLSDRTHDKHARESAGMARRFLLQAKLELNPLSAALKSRIELAPDVYFATASPLQLVEEILKISEWNWRYGRYWTSQPSEELKRLLPFWTTM